MYNFFDFFFFGVGSKKSTSDLYKLNKKWAGLNIFYELLSLVMGRFVYTLPETMDDRFFELVLISRGVNGTGMGRDGELGNFSVGYGNHFSKYGYYNNVNLMDYMGMSQGQYIPDCPGNVEPDCVLTYDNKYNVPPIFRIKWYADRLTSIQGSIAACICNLKGTVIFKCTREQEPAIRRAWKNADDGSPVIISFAPGEGGYDLDPEVITNPQTGDILKALQEAYDKTMADFLTEFGINANGVINKLSGVSNTELQQNEQATLINLHNALKMREQGIEKINAMFGVEAKVELAEALQPPELPDGLQSYQVSNKQTVVNSNNDSREYN